MSWQERFDRDIMHALAMPLAELERGEGCRVMDAEGRWYLDFLAGIAVNSLGHAHPVFVDAVSTQAAKLAHVSNYFATGPQLELAERLLRLADAGAGRVLFGNSGTEANEAAFKLARLNGGAERPRILALDNAFHGRTMGALALTGKPAMRADFEPMPGGVEHIPATIEALEAAMDERVAALFVEPVQGEAGVVDLPAGYLQRARELTADAGALLIVDEIQTGAGRTGQWFGFQHAGIRPDAITVAKGMGGGFPIGALVAFGDAAGLFTPGQHGTTYGGNPLATAVSNAVLGEIERAGLVARAAATGIRLREIVAGLGSPLVTGTSGLGLLVGVRLAESRAVELMHAALAEGLIVNAANPSTIRLAPPLIAGDPELEEFADLFGRALARLEPRTGTDHS